MSTLRTNTLQNAAGTASVPVDTVVSGSAKAWVNFNGTGTVAIRAGFNVSSITDNGTGQYRVNFTNAMPDANYSISVGVGSSSGDTVWPVYYIPNTSNGGAPSTSSFGINTGTVGSATLDAVYVNISVHR